MKKILFPLAILFGIVCIPYTYATEPVMCTMEAKMCADGSYVGRVGPNCEFAPCPDETDPPICNGNMIYAPVCGEIQIQCFTTPCLPIQQTFSNICELEQNPLATYLYDGECDSNPVACTMEYAPVCGVDGITYGNTCSAGKVGVKYNGECLSKKNEIRIQSAWDRIITEYFFGYTDGKKVIILEKVYNAANTLAENENYNEAKSQFYMYVGYLAKQDLHEIYEVYIKNHISHISLSDPVLGGTWYVTRIIWSGLHSAKVEYEDGHIAENINIKMSVLNGNIQASVIK